MKSYFIRQDNKPEGPYSIDQLKEMRLSPAALVYAEGLKQWIKALEIPELQQELFPAQPQLAGHYSSAGIKTPDPARQKNSFSFAKNLKTILAVIALIIATLLLIELKKSKTHSASIKTVNRPVQTAVSQTAVSQPAKTSTQVRTDARQKEMANPVGYINAQIGWRKNLVGFTVLEGTLSNTATVANFKDPVILVTWLSKSDATIATNQFSLNKNLPAGETISYKLKVPSPSKFADVRVSVVSATAAQ